MENIDREFYLCPKCANNGMFDIKKEGNLIKCGRCNHVSTYVTCGSCGCAGDFLEYVGKKNLEWECHICGRVNRLHKGFYDRYIVIKDMKARKKFNKKKRKEKGVNKGKVYLYLVLYVFSLVIVAKSEGIVGNVLELLVGSLGIASGFYCMIPLVFSIRMSDVETRNRIINFIKDFRVWGRELLLHIGIVMIVLGIMVFIQDGDTESGVVEYKPVEEWLIDEIVERYGRKDVVRITKF